jgi:hypothetical protein
MTVHVYFLFPETAGKPLEEVTEMFEDPNGIKYIGTPAWKTKNYYSSTVRMEHGENVRKVVDEESSPERMASTGHEQEKAV